MRIARRGSILLVAGLMGCLGEKASLDAEKPAAATIGTVLLSPPAAIMAVGGTQQLNLTAASLAGTPVTAFDSVVYGFDNKADTLRIRFSPTGLLTALAPTTIPVLVNVIVYQGGGLRGDQMLAQVTATAISGATLSIQPVAPDSAKLAVGSVKTIVPMIRNASTGTTVANPIIRYQVKTGDAGRVGVYKPYLHHPLSLDALPLQIPESPAAAANQIVAKVADGSAWVYATINVYGTLLQDSVQYAFSYPYTIAISTTKNNLALTSTLAYQTVTLAAGATVTFTDGISTTDPLRIVYTFANPAGATAATTPSSVGGASGDVTTLAGGQSSLRRFLTPGTYRWTMTASGGPAPWAGQTFPGTIIIK